MIIFQIPIYYGYCYHSVNVITFGEAQSDHIKRLLLYIDFSRTTPVKQEPSVTPPPPKYSKDVHMDGSGAPVQRKRNSRKSSNETTSESEAEKRSKKQKCPNKSSKGNKEQAASNPDGSKRVYVCPHCQRSYDWNYNLVRICLKLIELPSVSRI